MRSALIVLAMSVMCARAEEPPPVEGVKGTVIHPLLGPGKVKITRVSKPGEYKAKVGDLIELEYRFPRGASPGGPKANAKKATAKPTENGAVVPSDLGIRFMDDGESTDVKLLFFFVAKKAGKDTITLDIDDNQYEYKFEVLAEK
jgi:hypothetical protein